MSLKGYDSSTPEPIRKLVKNDINQTTDQWKDRVLHKLGETSGLWATRAKRGEVPKVPTTAPLPPVKPSSEGIMNSLKSRMRAAQYRDAVAARPQLAGEKTVDDFPLPDDYEAWQEYERLKVRYQQEAREYERQEKLALETFPNENKKVFSALIDCISEASVQDLKRSQDGAKYFQEGDFFSFFNLAIKEHEYLTPTISSAAVARAKDEFEGLRQRSEDSIIQHINEYRRLLEVYVEARGEGLPSPYADFDLRYLLLRSLYQPVWSSWIEYREANDNLPGTFDELVEALKRAEATKILRSSSPVDPMMGTAHATAAVKRSSSPATPSTEKCAVCGAPFCPKRPQHTRCDKCQEAHAKERKKERKKMKDKQGGKKAKGKMKKLTEAKAHRTTAEEDESDSDSDEGEEIPQAEV